MQASGQSLAGLSRGNNDTFNNDGKSQTTESYMKNHSDYDSEEDNEHADVS
jgi:hypothetical protein